MQTSTLPKDYSQALKGLLALVIIGTHVSASMRLTEDTPYWLRLCNVLVPLALGLYFFFSGYGLMTQLKAKEARTPGLSPEVLWRGWLPRRLWALLKPFLAFFVISLFLRYVARGFDTFSWAELGGYLRIVFHGWSRGWLINMPTAWFLVELLGLYLLFFVAFRWSRDRRWGLVLLPLLIGGLIFVLWRLDFSPYWLRYPLIFALGVYYAYAEGQIYTALTSRRLWVLVSLVPLLWWYVAGAMRMTSLDPVPWYKTLSFALASHLLPLLVVVLSKHYGVTDFFMRHRQGRLGRALLLLGDISLEVYLLHMSFVWIFRGPVVYIQSPWGFTLAVYTSTLLVSYLLMRYASRLIRA